MRKQLAGILTAALVMTVLLSMSPMASAQGDIKAAIEAQNRKFSAAVEKGDAAAIADLYSANAMVLPPNSDTVEGKEAIKGLFQGFIDSGVKGLILTTLEAERQGDFVHEVGKYSLKGENGKELDKGKYIVVWKREGGKWKLHRDIFNTSMPAATR